MVGSCGEWCASARHYESSEHLVITEGRKVHSVYVRRVFMKDNTDTLVAVEGEDRVKNIPDDGSSITEKDRKW